MTLSLFNGALKRMLSFNLMFSMSFPGSVHQILDGHFHYVQGVAWDPLSKYVASLSSDRSCRIYINKPSKTKGIEKMNFVCQHVIAKIESQTVDESKVGRDSIYSIFAICPIARCCVSNELLYAMECSLRKAIFFLMRHCHLSSED